MRRSLLLTTALLFVIAATAQLPGKRSQVKDAHDRYANMDTALAILPEGTDVKDGNVALKNGYRVLMLDSSRVIVIQRSNGETTGAFRCGCATGNRGVTFTKNEIHCINGCSMDVVLNPGKNSSITHSSGNWKKLTIPAAVTGGILGKKKG